MVLAIPTARQATLSPKRWYNLVVVGSRPRGVTAAGLLAKRHLSDLTIEQQGKPGGCCTSFRRAGVTFDVGAAILYGFGERRFKPFRFLINELAPGYGPL